MFIKSSFSSSFSFVSLVIYCYSQLHIVWFSWLWHVQSLHLHQQCCTFFERLIGQSAFETKVRSNTVSQWFITIGHQTCKRKICGCECEKLKVTSPIISSGTGVIKWFLIKKLLSVQFTAYKACSILTLHNTLWPLTSSKKWCLCGTDVFVNTSVFCTALRLEFSGKTMVGLSTAS